MTFAVELSAAFAIGLLVAAVAVNFWLRNERD